MRKPLEIDNVHIAYGDTQVVRGVSLGLEAGEIGCLLGPSGCGKTTLLRAIAGFEPLCSGKIRLEGRTLSTQTKVLAPEKRGIGMVFQDFALFPHLSVSRNIGFGLGGLPASRRQARIEELLKLVALPGIADCYPHQLSGGQQQRVALVRALAPQPSLLLLDEPFSSMDGGLRESLAREVRKILKAEGTTALLVTHDQTEAFAMADRIAVMDLGKVRQWGTAFDLYHRPVDRFVAGFVGQGVMLPVLRDSRGVLQSELGPLPGQVSLGDSDTPMDMLLRPDHLVYREDGLMCEIVERSFRGAECLYRLRLPSGNEVLYETRGRKVLAIGSMLPIALGDIEPVLFRVS